MKIFEKRPLSLILCIMLTVFSLSLDAEIGVKLAIIAASIVIFSLTFISSLFSIDKRALVRIAAAASFLSVVFSIAWATCFYKSDIFGEEKRVEGTVSDISEGYNYSKLTVSVGSINGEDAELKILVHYYYNDLPSTGDKISFTATLSSIKEYAGEDVFTYYYADGITAVATDVIDIDLNKTNEFSINRILNDIRASITNTLIKRTDSDTGGFLSALLIGDKTYLDSNTTLSFRRLGISHILALSGMHLAIITHALERILKTIHIHKKLRVCLTSVFTVFYMAIVGFTPSITRSGIMLLIYYLLYLVARKQDSITSLFIAVSIIVFISPTSVFDISLWLSAFATLGVIISSSFTERRTRAENIFVRALIFCLSSLVSSFFAISCTLVLTVSVFGSVSVIFIFTTLLFSFPIMLLIYLGITLLLIGAVLPLGYPIIFISDLIKELADRMASPKWVLASSNFLSVKILTLVFTIYLILFLVLDIKKRKAAVTTLALIFVSIFLISGISNARQRGLDTAYTDVSGNNDTVLLKSDSSAFVIQSGDTSLSGTYHILSILNSERLTYLDELVLTSIPNSLVTDLEPLINSVRVGLIRVPTPKTEYELYFCRELASMLSRYGTTMRFYKDTLDLGKLRYELIYRTDYSEGTDSEAVYTLSTPSSSCVYFTSGAGSIVPLAVLERVEECDVLILGLGGESSAPFDICFDRTKRIIVNGKGKLADSAFEYYADRTIEIFYNSEAAALFR